MRKFFKVDDSFEKVEGETVLPTRATKGSGGYDLCAKTNYTVKPKEIVKIWTDVKVAMNEDEIFLINVRSSMAGKFMLANTQGWIDNDYFSNEKNDGNIGVFLMNISDDVQYIYKGDKIAQGLFTKFLITDDDVCDIERKGGFGSTGR